MFFAMMDYTRLLKALLHHDFYEANAHIIDKNMFGKELASLVGTLQYAMGEYKKDLDVGELLDLHVVRNPDITQATKFNLEQIVQRVKDEQEYTPEIAQEIIVGLRRQELAREIADVSLAILNGEHNDFSGIQAVLDKTSGVEKDIATLNVATKDLGELLEAVKANVKWRFNLASLHRQVAGIGPGIFTILGARPEVGKTALYVSLVSAPGGFADQGAKVIMALNEEPAVRTQLRCYSSFLGMTQLEIENNINIARTGITKIRDNVTLYDCVGISMDELNQLAKREKPDVFIIDNLDKVKISGDFTRDDTRLKETYVQARELTKRHECATIGISQVSADGEGRIRLNQAMLENSKTGKAAEADLIMLVGAAEGLGDLFRNLNIVKNKITGVHTEVGCKIEPPVSRYTE